MNQEDVDCLKIHGIKYNLTASSDSDESKLDFDSDYEANKPPPIQIDPLRHRILVVSKRTDDDDGISLVEAAVGVVKKRKRKKKKNQKSIDKPTSQANMSQPIQLSSCKQETLVVSKKSDNGKSPTKPSIGVPNKSKKASIKEGPILETKQVKQDPKANPQLKNKNKKQTSHATTNDSEDINMLALHTHFGKIIGNLNKCYETLAQNLGEFKITVNQRLLLKKLSQNKLQNLNGKKIEDTLECTLNQLVLNFIDDLNATKISLLKQGVKKNIPQSQKIGDIENNIYLKDFLRQSKEMYLSKGLKLVENKQKEFQQLLTEINLRANTFYNSPDILSRTVHQEDDAAVLERKNATSEPDPNFGSGKLEQPLSGFNLESNEFYTGPHMEAKVNQNEGENVLGELCEIQEFSETESNKENSLLAPFDGLQEYIKCQKNNKKKTKQSRKQKNQDSENRVEEFTVDLQKILKFLDNTFMSNFPNGLKIFVMIVILRFVSILVLLMFYYNFDLIVLILILIWLCSLFVISL